MNNLPHCEVGGGWIYGSGNLGFPLMVDEFTPVPKWIQYFIPHNLVSIGFWKFKLCNYLKNII